MLPESFNLKLWPVKREHLPLLRKWRNDERVYKWCRQFEPITEEQHEAWFNSLHDNPSVKMYVIARAMSNTSRGEVVGVCGLTSIDWLNRRAEFSLYIGPEYQSRGYGGEALRVLLRHGFKVLNLNSIWGEVYDGNPALEVFKAVGFKEEGKRRAFYYRDGKYIDATLISVLRDELVGM